MTDLERFELILRTVKSENSNLDTLTITELLDLLIDETQYRNKYQDDFLDQKRLQELHRTDE